ncbi:unnamed protein product [Linum tenue]|uniref:Cytochrome P450 n=1 Tax=Linum tenue TaxID=586396 RepID=A0AAV0N8T7_9ROSI|nr:unnamed protein product [Linum tenue]
MRTLFRDIPIALWQASSLHDFTTRLLKLNNGTLLLSGPMFLNGDMIITSDPMNAHHILSTNFTNYEKGRDFKAIMDAYGDGIINSDGESWKLKRQLVHSLINTKEFEDHVMKVMAVKLEHTLFRVLDDCASSSEVVDIQDVFKRFMFDNICLLVLGFDPGYLRPAGLLLSTTTPTLLCGKAFDDLKEAVVYRHIVPKFLWRIQKRLDVGVEKKASRSRQILDDFIYARIETRKQELVKLGGINDDNNANDVLTRLLVTGQDKSDKFVRDTVFSLIGAGRDLISSALTWFLWLVVTHPIVEGRILHEIKLVMDVRRDDDDQDRLFFTKVELNKLVYLHVAICETLRLYPPAPFEHKCAVEADVLPSGHGVPKGTKILFSIYSMGRMEEIWGEDCTEFKPERWISEKGNVIHVPSYKLMAFLAGPRTCTGKAIAFLQLKSMASAILWNYKFDIVEGHVVKPTAAMILLMKDGLKMRVSKRGLV